ncbi:radical SAM family heme chaperone HemW [Fervidibacillus halotolerans]|uniref:Heme chaperone HemW n=1 Tax=Fervidibacillus halotolerans TaxID=2980027 RepID=A0A9E8LY16_9BACI|nr:radical SAM family heme chaperone HemW [Fervidibacillus halotolerans]WAA11512.1 radical SAM family heme chaperone HemW [Fervidibacillus halotolerans]
MAKAVYIHIPFCTQICHYCDFNKVYLNRQPVDDYLIALKKEIHMTLEEAPTSLIETVFIGGGTPTALNESQLEFLLESIHQTLPTNTLKEFTIEANPGDLNGEKIRLLKDGGVNRLSLGVQTFNNELLKKIGRNHSVQQVYETVDAAKKYDFENISIDLMYRLPGQSMKDLRHSLLEFKNLQIPHASIYSLIIEPKTIFYNLMRKGKLPLPSEDVEADMYQFIIDEMASYGYKQYEISNFSKPGLESRHNLVYWNNESYYGFGAGAHSYLHGIRSSNIGPVNHYIQAVNAHRLPKREKRSLTKQEQMEEEMFLGLRKTAGVSVSKFTQKYGIDPLHHYDKQITQLVEKGLLEVGDGQIRLTKKGLFFGNVVFQSFIEV